MARALARGWGEPVLCTDPVPGKAEALAAELGGEALASNAELARARRPRRSSATSRTSSTPWRREVAGNESGPRSSRSSRGVTLDALRAAYPARAVVRADAERRRRGPAAA